MEEGQSRGTLSLHFSESQIGDPSILRALKIQYEMYQKITAFAAVLKLSCGCLYCYCGPHE